MSADSSRASVRNPPSWLSATSTMVTDRRVSEKPGNDALQQRDELAANSSCSLHHFVVLQRLWQHTGRHVRDARDAKHLDAHVTRHNRFRYGGHAHGIRADRPKISDLGGGL